MKKEQETENNKTEEKKGDMRKEVVSWVRMFVIVMSEYRPDPWKIRS